MFKRNSKVIQTSNSSDDFTIQTENVVSKLQKIYKRLILPAEKKYNYQYFFSPYLTDAEFESKPQVMLVGQYSVGKTSFIRVREQKGWRNKQEEEMRFCSYDGNIPYGIPKYDMRPALRRQAQ